MLNEDNQPPKFPPTAADNSEPGTRELNLTPHQRRILLATVAEGLLIQDRFRPEPLYKNTGKGQFDSQTLQEIGGAQVREEESG